MPTYRAALAELNTLRPSGILSCLGLADSSDDLPPAWLIQAVRSASALWWMVLLAKLCSAAFLFDPSWLTPVASETVIVASATAILADLLIWMLPRTPLFNTLRPHMRMCAMLPMMFASGAAFSFWTASLPGGNVLLSVPPLMCDACIALIAVAICGNSRILGVAYCLGAAVAGFGISGGLVQSGPFVIWFAVLILAAIHQARTDHERLKARQIADMRGLRAERLLLEHERSGRGWFWETDRTARIGYISESLAQSLGTDAASLVGRPLTDLITAGDKQRGDGERTIGFHLSARTAFAEIPVRAAMSQQERWWAMSGQPIIDEFGQFHGFRGSGTDLTEMRRSQAEVTRLAQYDSLTGLANRLQMMQTLEQAVTNPRGQPGDCALMMIDLDRFKSVNDTLGHPAGDQLLRLVSERLQRVVGDQGMVGRLGGDEFKVVMPGRAERAKLSTMAETIIANLSLPYPIDGNQVVIGASVGISICPDDGQTTDALIRNADLALYAAKGDGRGIHRFYAPEMHADAEDRRRLEEDLREALSGGGFYLVYQPVVSAKTEKVTGYEALLRWNHAVRGEISPSVFIPIAEDAGLIFQIGDWVMRTACHDASTWPHDIRVAVNVSPIQFANPAFPGTVVSALAGSRLAPGRLELEITESVFLNDDADNDAMFARLKAIGVRLALDDFGTGYSSLGYLKKAPFDKIKIDQSFVRGAVIAGSRNSAIVKSIVSLAEALQMDTTAEGAETHDELELIRQLGCSHVQGYIYGRPMPAEDITARLAQDGIIAKADGFQSSRPARRTMLRSIAVLHDGHRYPARVRNISATGALVEGLWNVPNDTVFKVELADGYIVEATSRWCNEDRIGIAFSAAIDFGKLKAHPAIRLAS